MKLNKKTLFVLLLSALLLFVATACSNNEKASAKEGDNKTEEKADQAKEDEGKSEETADETKEEPKNEEQEVHDFVLEDTKMVKVFNISKTVKDDSPDLGPFFVVRGIDERGQKSEIWIKDMKIYEMINIK